MPSLVLASSSPYRRELLARLKMPFAHHSPDIDETAKADETPQALVLRLAEEKSRALSNSYPQHLIIGSDQVAVLQGQVIGKPGNFEQATQQLLNASGRQVDLLTGLAVLNTATGHLQVDCVPFTVHFRELTEAQITRYLLAEEPYDCAGSFKAEGLGISLFRRMEGEDPTSLIGLPLIRLTDMLRTEDLEIP